MATGEELKDDDEDVELSSMDAEAAFASYTVWDHDVIPETQDQLVRGVQEWIAFSTKVHGVEAPI